MVMGKVMLSSVYICGTNTPSLGLTSSGLDWYE